MVGYSWHWIENWRRSWSEWDGCARQMALVSFHHRRQHYASWSLPLQIRWYCELHCGKAHLQNTKGVLDEDIRYVLEWVWWRRHCGLKLCVWTLFFVTMNYNLCVKRVYQAIPLSKGAMKWGESVAMPKNKQWLKPPRVHATNSLYWQANWTCSCIASKTISLFPVWSGVSSHQILHIKSRKQASSVDRRQHTAENIVDALAPKRDPTAESNTQIHKKGILCTPIGTFREQTTSCARRNVVASGETHRWCRRRRITDVWNFIR